MNKQSWRFIYTGTNDPYFNMAVDEALLCSVQKGSLPVLRLYEWKPATVSIGYFQQVKKTVDLNKCTRAGVKFVRRITGGRAVLHNAELTYSLTGSSGVFKELGENVSETYRRVSAALLASLSIMGIEAGWVKPSGRRKGMSRSSSENEDKSSVRLFHSPACFSSFSRYEVSFQGRKLVGSAQRRFGEVFLQHGSILIKPDDLRLTDFFPEGSITEKVALGENSISLEEIKREKVEIFEIVHSLKEGFSSFFQRDFEEDSLTSDEVICTQRLIKEKYSQVSWNLKY